MKANELMVGDWVFCTYPSINKPVRVSEIKTVGDNKLKIVINDDDIRLVFNETYIDPIPLTPEILDKNFEKETFYGIYNDYFDLDIMEYSDSIYVATFHNCEASFPDQSVTLSFVHELQHFLNHCGIEHEITL